MPHQDQTVHTEPAAHHQDLKAVLDWLLAGADLSGARFRDLCTWTPRGLTCAALLWAWSGETALTERFAWARKIALVTLDLGPLTAATYQAFLKMLRAWTVVLATALVTALRRRMQEDLAGRFLVGGYAVSPSTAAGWNCRGPCPTRRTSPHAAAAIEAEAASRSPPRPPAPRPPAQEGEQSADVADHDVARRHRAALGLAARAVRQPSATTSSG
ncbi:MAG: hypothetical protein WKF75_09770 [Singulisphaera sp.]